MEAGNNSFNEPDDQSDQARKAAHDDAYAFFEGVLGDSADAMQHQLARNDGDPDTSLTPVERRMHEETAGRDDTVSFEERSTYYGLTDADRALIPKDDIEAFERIDEAMYIVGGLCAECYQDIDKAGLVLRQTIASPGDGKEMTVLQAFTRPETHAIAMEYVSNPDWLVGVLYQK